MAKLDILANQIQSTVNMIKYPTQASDWTNDKYPSAQAVADLVTTTTAQIIEACENASGSAEFPVGSILITSTNVSPAASVGGEWELVDKEYKTVIDNAIGPGWTGWTPAMTGSTVSGAIIGGWIARANHTICLKFYFTTKAEIDGSTTSLNYRLGDLSRPLSGASEGGFPLTNHYGMAYAVDASKNTYLVGYQLDGGGSFYVTSIYDKKKLPAESQLQIHLILNMSTSTMLDSACDKFYWKRTA